MKLSRRALLAATPLAFGAPALAAPLEAEPFQHRIAFGRQPVIVLPARDFVWPTLEVTNDLKLVGSGRRLVANGAAPLFRFRGAGRVRLENLILEGAGGRGGDLALVEVEDVADFAAIDCRFSRNGAHALRLRRSGGRVERCGFRDIGRVAVHVDDGAGVTIADNDFADCGEAGVQVFREKPGYDGAIVRGNRFARIRADPGGDGPYGNAINAYRANGVAISANIVRGAAFSAIRCNSCEDPVVTGNSCLDSGETAIFIEFAQRAAAVTGNLIDGAANGIALANLDNGGRLGTVSGNTVRNLTRAPPQKVSYFGVGISAEADAAVVGNVVENASYAGVMLGYGAYLDGALAADNVARDCGYGVAVTVALGAGGATIRDNRIAGAKHGAIVGLAWEKLITADLAADAARFPQIALGGNVVT